MLYLRMKLTPLIELLSLPLSVWIFSGQGKDPIEELWQYSTELLSNTIEGQIKVDINIGFILVYMNMLFMYRSVVMDRA